MKKTAKMVTVLTVVSMLISLYASLGVSGAIGDTYTAEGGYSSTVQGANGWFYEYEDGGVFKQMEHHWHSGSWTASPNASTWPGFAILGSKFTHPHEDARVSRRWVVPESGVIKIEGSAQRGGSGWSNGVKISIENDDNIIYENTYGQASSGTTPRLNYTVYAYVTQGNNLRFICDALGNSAEDGSDWDISITYINPSDIPLMYDVKSVVFKENGLAIADNNIPVTQGSEFSVEMEIENKGSITLEPVILLALYGEGNEMIEVNFSDNATITEGQTQTLSTSFLIPEGIDYNFRAKAYLFDNLQNIKPLIQSVSFPGAYIAEKGFSLTTQGANGWYYEYYNSSTGQYEQMPSIWTVNSNYWTATEPTNYALLGATFTHPAANMNVARRWVVPRSGAIKIEGSAKREGTQWSNGVGITIKTNDDVIYENTYGAGESGQATAQLNYTAYAYVSAGDDLRFICDALGNSADDGSQWSISIIYIDSSEMPF